MIKLDVGCEVAVIVIGEERRGKSLSSCDAGVVGLEPAAKPA